MDLTALKTIKELLSKYKGKPQKRLGQNFLIDKRILDKIISASDIKPDDIILEVGPGLGTLTKKLAKDAGKVIAIEKDKKMVEVLQETSKDYKNIEIINADILGYQPLTTNYKLIANIPYYITAPLIRHFLENPNPPKEIILMIQKEVAQRICSKPPDMTLLSVSVQFYAEPKIISYVSKNCFWPAPKVDSAIIKITPHPKPAIDAGLFFKIVKAGFSQPRKQIGSNLSKMLKLDKGRVGLWLSGYGINQIQRAETLSIDDWKNLTKSFHL